MGIVPVRVKTPAKAYIWHLKFSNACSLKKNEQPIDNQES